MIGVIITIIVVICIIIIFSLIKVASYGEFLKDKNGNLNGIITVKLESKKDEKTGRMVMSEVPGSETKLDADLVLIAAGFLGTEKYVADAFGVELAHMQQV